MGRIHSVHPSAGERFFLRCLLNHVTGETLAPKAGQGDCYNFETLRNVPGRDAPAATYREACELRGLLRDDKEWHDTMSAASTTSRA